MKRIAYKCSNKNEQIALFKFLHSFGWNNTLGQDIEEYYDSRFPVIYLRNPKDKLYCVNANESGNMDYLSLVDFFKVIMKKDEVRVGRRYEHKTGIKYVLTSIYENNAERYALVAYDAPESYKADIGRTYSGFTKPGDPIEKVFASMKSEYFTAID